MGPRISSAAGFLTSTLALLFGLSSVLGQDLRETDVLCNTNGCFVVYFQRRTFLESWRACKDKGGNLATVKRNEDAASIARLFSALDLSRSGADIDVWIGLQRQPRQCSGSHPLRGFSWTTGDQDTEYTNWQREDSPNSCMVPRCVVMSYSTTEQAENLKWLDGSCSVPADGYLCHFGYKGMCPALWTEGGGNVLYSTPFNFLSTLLTHIPQGSVATMPCPGTMKEQTVMCMLRDDSSVGWSRESPLCSDPLVSHHWCEENNGGCEHFCREAGGQAYCECDDGFQLGDDGQSCELSDVCREAPCEFVCLPLSGEYRCACPEGYMLAPDEESCLDVDECLQNPCEQLCQNAPGTFECRCWEGYHQDEDVGCEDVDECIDEPCEHACENTPGSHVCHCHLGYDSMPEDPTRCQDIDECLIAGTCEQMCVNYEGGFECYCEEGYELMGDGSSCRKRGEGDDQVAITSPFPWATHQPGPLWEMDYDWTLQQGNTDWPPVGERFLNWLTDPPRIQNSDVIWVTSAPQEEVPYDPAVDVLTQADGSDERDPKPNPTRAFWLETGQLESEGLPNTIVTTILPKTILANDPSSYEDEEETTTALPFLPTTTISEGASNWWADETTSSHKPGNPGDSAVDPNMDSSDHNEEQDPQRKFPDEGRTHSQDVPTLSTPSQPNSSESGGVLDPVFENSEHSNTWLLVGLLVPICILILVVVALVIMYCTHCALRPRGKNISDCYHWISGAHDAQGAPDPSAGVKTNV